MKEGLCESARESLVLTGACFAKVLHQHFLKSPLRTDDADKAQLFFIPVYLGRHYNWFWQQWSTPGKAWDVAKDCQPHHTPSECFWEKWTGAKEVLLLPIVITSFYCFLTCCSC